jgi:hypothetical protein
MKVSGIRSINQSMTGRFSEFHSKMPDFFFSRPPYLILVTEIQVI